jgi:hypothetical protein
MARKQISNKIGSEVKAPVSKTTTTMRSSPIPKVTPTPLRKEITHEMIAERAYYIAMSGQGGSELDNWLRAERELRSA